MNLADCLFFIVFIIGVMAIAVWVINGAIALYNHAYKPSTEKAEPKCCVDETLRSLLSATEKAQAEYFKDVEELYIRIVNPKWRSNHDERSESDDGNGKRSSH